MNATSIKTDAWAMIETEKRRDRLIRRICIGAWSATFVIMVLFALVTIAPVIQMMGGALNGDLPWITVLGSAMPFIGALWTLTLLVSALSTVAVFLRLRTASLSEIQLRLAALEEMLAARGDADNIRS
jgi:hypothetical protein